MGAILEPFWEALLDVLFRALFGALLEPLLGPLLGALLDALLVALLGILGSPGRRLHPPREANEALFGLRGEITEGVLSLRTSEFWRPVLGDLEAKNLDSLEDDSLVAKSRALNSLVAPQGGRWI